MNSIPGRARLVAAVIGSLTLMACDSIKNVEDEDFSQLPTPSVVLRGQVSGLTTSPVVLTANYVASAGYVGTAPQASIVREVSDDGPVSFAAIPQGSQYTVAVTGLPIGKLCNVANASGTAQSNVTNVAVTCAPDPDAPTYTVSGTVVGLAPSATAANLQLTLSSPAGSETVTVPAAGTGFTFTSELLTDFDYTVAIATAPAEPGAFGGPPVPHNCVLNNETGTVVSTDITNVEVTCGFTVGGTVTGHFGTTLGAGLKLALNYQGVAVETIDVAAAATTVQFAGRRPSHPQASYAVSVAQQPTGQVCIVGDAGAVSLTTAANVSDVAVWCDVLPLPADQLTGTYSTGRNFMTFFADGTFLHGTHGATAGSTGLEHGLYRLNCCGPDSLWFTVVTDTNGADAGLSALPLTFGGLFGTGVVRTAGPPATISATFGATVLTLTAVESTADQLTGAWATADRQRVFIYNSADGTGFHMGVNGQANVQDVCLTIATPAAASGIYTQNRATCTIPGGLTFVDTDTSGFIGLPGAPLFGGPPGDIPWTVTAGSPGTMAMQPPFGAPAINWTRSLPN